MTLQEACETAAAARVPVFFEPVSAAKAVRAARMLHRISFLSPNAAELATLAAEVRHFSACATRAQPTAAAGRSQPTERSSAFEERWEGQSGWVLQKGAPLSADRADAAARLMAAAPDLQAVLAAGAAHVLLTLGAMGAALCRQGVRSGAWHAQPPRVLSSSWQAC